MILEKGNMWDAFGSGGLFLLTTNPIVRKDGAVVMGRGIAKEAATRFPTLPYDFGKRLFLKRPGGRPWTVGEIGYYDGWCIGFFMVKDHWREPAKLEIIQESVNDLKASARGYTHVNLNFPGIGNGKLKREDVLPIIEQLPDNVHVWEYGE